MSVGKKVHVVSTGSYINRAVESLFRDRAYRIVKLDEKPHFLAFTGGEDISPHYYRETPLVTTRFNPRRDAEEKKIFDQFKDIPKVGICRGGQFLNVMSGGAMWQHVNNHATGKEHKLNDLLLDRRIINVTSTHHQMMIPGNDGEIIAIAKEATNYLSHNGDRKSPLFDTEVVFYPTTNSLCYQPHPEYSGVNKDNRDYFFDLIDYFWN